MAYNENTTISGLYSGKSQEPKERDYSIYNYQYYSGTDVSIYFGDTWVDEIVAIQFQLQEKVSPIYGYADYVYSHLARGNRVVYGKFRINFTEAGYLKAITTRLSDASNKLNAIPDAISRESKVISKQNIDESDFEKFAEFYESTIWGDKGKDIMTEAKEEKAPRLALNSFDIVIGYGATPSSTNTSVMSNYSKQGSTMQIIRNVTLTGKTQVIDTSDNVIFEEYDFIGQDIV